MEEKKPEAVCYSCEVLRLELDIKVVTTRLDCAIKDCLSSLLLIALAAICFSSVKLNFITDGQILWDEIAVMSLMIVALTAGTIGFPIALVRIKRAFSEFQGLTIREKELLALPSGIII